LNYTILKSVQEAKIPVGEEDVGVSEEPVNLAT